MSQETGAGAAEGIGRRILHKALLVVEIVAGYAAFSLTGAVGVWLVFGRLISMGELFNTAQSLNGLSVLLVSLIKIALFTAVIYGLQRLRRQNMGDLGLRSPSLGWPRLLLVSTGASVVGQAVLFAAQRLIGEGAEAALPAFDLSTPLSLAGWIGVGWVHGGFGEELLYRGFLLARFEALFGKRPWSTVVAVVLLVAFFGLGHAYQGATGIILTAVSSLVFWGVYFGLGRSLWASVVAHGCWDMIGWLLMASGL